MNSYEFRKFLHYKPESRSVQCLRLNYRLQKLAVVRASNTIEIWDVKLTPNLDRTIAIDSDDSAETVAWSEDRIFSAGIAGKVSEYDLLTCSVKQSFTITSGSCWCMDVSSDQKILAACSEDGYINIINIESGCLQYEKLLDRQDGRILCVGWEHSGKFIVTGSIDAIRIWNVKTGHAIHKLIPGRSEMKNPTIVWCLSITKDFTVITGDSRGKVTFWDGTRGLQIDSHQSHKAAILAMCLDENDTKLYCAGVDPMIASFEKINVRSRGSTGAANYKWVKSVQRLIHDHDVRSLTMWKEKLYSGGVDGYFALSSYPPKVVIKYSPMLQTKRLFFASEVKILLVAYEKHMEIWHWPSNSPPSFVAIVKAFKDQYIRCAAISPDGRWIIYSTNRVVRLLKFSFVADPLHADMKKIRCLPSNLKSVAFHLCFSPDSRYLLAVDKHRAISVVDLKAQGPTQVTHKLNAEEPVLKDVIHLISISKNNDFIVVADRSSNIAVWKNFNHYCSLPKSSNAPTAMVLNSDFNYVLVTYADHKIVEFDLNRKRFTPFSKSLDQKHPKEWLSRQLPVEGILFDSNNPEAFMIYDDSTIFMIDKNKNLPEISCKIPRLEVKSPDNSENSESSNSSHITFDSKDNIAFHVLKEFKHLVFLCALHSNEFGVVKVSPNVLTEDIPKLLLRKKYGIL